MPAFRWPKLQHDLALATEVAALRCNTPSEWETIADRLSKAFSTEDNIIELKGRGCRERLERLLQKYKSEDARSLKRSGTEEDFNELSQLLEDILIYRRDMQEEMSKEKEVKKKKVEEDKKKAETMRQAAMEGMAKRKHKNESSEDEDEDERDVDEQFDGARARGKGRGKGTKRSSKLTAMELLNAKYEQKAALKESELQLKRMELEFQQKKYEDELAERRQRLELELEERRAMLDLMKNRL